MMRFPLLAVVLLMTLALSPLATASAAGVITFTSPAPNSNLYGTQSYTIRGTVSPVQNPDTIFIQVNKQGFPTPLDAQSVTMGINGTFIYKTNAGGSSAWTAGTYVISVLDSYGTSASETFTYTLTSTNTDSTNTVVIPAQISLPYGIAIQYTATVTDTSNSPSTPTGAISWSDGGAGGSFNGTSPSGCALSSAGAGTSSCSVIYASSGAGAFTVKATYPGDSMHSGSSGTASLTVSSHPTNTSVSPSAAPVTGGNLLTLTATVTDTGTLATPSAPTGSVSWSDGGAGGSFNPATCKLGSTEGGQGPASCQVSYTAPSVAGSVTITAAYQADSGHASSKGTSTLTVSAATTTSSISTSTSSSSSTSSTSSSSTTTSSTTSTSSSTTSTITTTSTSPTTSTTSSSITTSSSSTTTPSTTSSSTSQQSSTTTSTTSSSSGSLAYDPSFLVVLGVVLASLAVLLLGSGEFRTWRSVRGPSRS